MAEPPPASSSNEAAQENAPLTANLQVLSPSVGVSRPLSFTGVPASTTVRQLKEKIRNTLPTRPADDQQRLIHRGRLLARDNETLQDVFGAETLQNEDQQTLHLVLRDLPDHHASSQQPTPLRGQSPAPGTLPGRPSDPHRPPQSHSAHARLVRTPVQVAAVAPPPNAHGPIADLAHHPTLASHLQMMQRQHEAMVHQTTVQWMHQIQREANYRQILNQQQRDRAAMGMHAGDNNNPQGQTARDIPSGRNSPAIGGQPTRATGRIIGPGPDGQYWRLPGGDEAAGARTSSPQPGLRPTGQGGVPGPADVQNLLRSVDSSNAARVMTNAMQRSASGASSPNMANMTAPIHPIPPGVTTPLFPNGSRHGSRTATPDPSIRTPSHGSTSAPSASQSTAPAQQPHQAQPEVYILSSPTGPRALLVNGASDVYFTPSLRSMATRTMRTNMPVRQTFSWTSQMNPQYNNQAHPQGQQMQLQQPYHQGQADNRARLPDAQLAPGAAQVPQHPHNPFAGGLMAPAIPHIWLLIRLTVFVWLWWFMASDRSWPRWLAVISVAIIAFAINTGLLNGVANQAWETFRRHVEGPLNPANAGDGARNNQGHEAQGVAGEDTPHALAATAAAAAGGGPRRHEEPDPAAAAARLVDERRNANANWLRDQMRRLERAGLLFIASIAPGVAERHIAHLEAQEREEQQRREAEAAAAREAAERAAAAEAEREAAEKDAAENATEAEAAEPATVESLAEQ